ncbi:MAG: VanZ family protein [Candidatus Methylacidiphilales bacterium]|nr:VanZ family protein [Candidatus Methylacidiphilales bacterium]
MPGLSRLRPLLTPFSFYALILILSSIPGSQIPHTDLTFGDKIIHFGVYSILGFLLARTGFAPLAMIALGMALGGFDETYQAFTPGRSPDVFDWVADALGITCGVVLFPVLYPILQKIFPGKRPSPPPSDP